MATSPDFSARPRTANPRMALSLESLGHPGNPTRQHSDPSPVASARNVAPGEGSVLWSQEDVAQEDLARPHTSNPRYSEMLGVDTPRVTETSARLDTPSRTSNDTTSAVLWASEARDIKPSMLARPTTSNPWLHRFLDGVPDAKVSSPTMTGPIDAERQRSLILWSEKAIEDWRMLARPHASNPVYESAQETSTPENTDMDRRGLSEVLWSSDEAAADGTPTVQQLQEVIVAQANRVRELEREVNDLRLRLNVVGELATCMPGSNRLASTPAQTPAQPRVVASKVQPEPAETTQQNRERSPSGVPESSRSQSADRRHVCVDPAPVDVVDDDASGDDGTTELFKREAADAKESRTSFADRLRAKTTARTETIARPDTASTRRTVDPPRAPARPVSAPVSRKTAAAARHDVMPSTFATIRSEAVVSDSHIRAAYEDMCLPGCDTVSKASFRRMYKIRAEEYGIAVSDATLDRLLRPYAAAGRENLSFEEFAVLFLQLQRW
uniref:EF-hand domain-containing protein n=1 Tax=Neobodo designis TaxID=312471 RepID=A0A7S1QCH8_NEODS